MGGGYSQRSEVKQLLKSATFNFIDFVMPQVAEKRAIQRLTSALMLPIGFREPFTLGLHALNQRRGGSVSISQSRHLSFCLLSNTAFFFYIQINIDSQSGSWFPQESIKQYPSTPSSFSGLAHMKKARVLFPALHKPSVIVCACNSSPQEVEKGRS